MNIEMTNIHKSFGTNRVLAGVDFDLREGEVHALMGENGAGKSTLMNILTGLHGRDEGKIVVDGQETYFANPKEAEERGVAFIHQELNIWPEMTVLDNLFIGKELTSGIGFLNMKQMKALAKEQFRKLAVTIPLTQEAGLCSVGQQQMIEIAKALMTQAKVIIMDEPTAALTEREIEKLFDVIRSLKKEGVSIVYISHRMEEIFTICDRITVMRDGKSVDTQAIPDTSFDEVVKKMVGRELTERYPARQPSPGETVLEVKNISGKGRFENVSFSVRAGEIVGVSGLMGAGRTEMMRAIFGLDPLDSGEVWVRGKKVSIRKPDDAVKHGIGFITEDRKDEGLVLDFSVRENMALPNLFSFSSRGFISGKKEQDFVDTLTKRLQIKTHSSETQARNLSGGNQQKVVIAKWIGIGPSVLILDEPTRGVDVGAKREIYQLMNELTERGVAILMVSSELPEVLGMSDRILVVHEGRISGELDHEQATQEQIMTLATGGQ
ncbi:ABC transporter related protein [Paenibacillus vortex V453]|jgi:ribose transport system ATP-binding protein|uniref:ABC transporter related protein n=1 Tax=Paenibacillus vortex V453 TaxID=715225 RepID=A0A2R9SWQ6_9BACL|nr:MULTISPECIES: sugar ABC transporter ATP-binding protein [Paenibacillus]ANA81863.1 D-xylose ABC transporter ATP-binding protein [Paenibacillus glucanolyticus]AVV59404.1 sugar ABC transporter ATP-binding protein [Paenibacillus glucanolyticus]EFU41750.1 ABC transporter related protein [Paenibacillus vortex V453]ETT43283.1 ABC transporter-like protein [Paenibacillus sp. FSL R5-808]MPY16065.1 sugar ABC transporter ATP-binding protein [Paenibacillus glucanolyticus]